MVDNLHRAKKSEIEEVFKRLNIEDLSDMDKYKELRVNVERALTDMQNHYRELAFSKIYSNRESIRKIDKANHQSILWSASTMKNTFIVKRVGGVWLLSDTK